MPTAEIKSSRAEFAAFARALKGDEKSEAQIFLDHFFRALGHGGVQEAGATLEFRIAKKPGSAQLELITGRAVAGVTDPGHNRPKGGKKFADLLWPERVLIEMKSRGQNLEKHYDQAFDYWTHIVPHRPPYVILCNFDEFWIYDFNAQLFDPVERVHLHDLAQSVSAFNFLLPVAAKPIFDTNIVCADALFAPWPEADAIIGNPPYLDARKVSLEHGDAYVKKIRTAFPGVPGRADFCVYWFRKAHDHLREGGRAGLVGTNTIRQNNSREGGLDYIVENGGVITEAVGTQVWSGDAAVHVSIVNWEKAAAELPGSARVPRAGEGVPPSRTSEAPPNGDTSAEPDASGSSLRRDAATSTRDARAPRTCRLLIQRGDHVDSPWETFDLPQINSALSPGLDVSGAVPLAANTEPQRCFNGQMIGHAGFLLSEEERKEMIRREPKSAEVLFPYLNGEDALSGATLDRYVIDFEQRPRFDAEEYHAAFDWVRAKVLPDRTRKAEEGKDADGKARPHHRAFLSRWWQLSFGRPEMLSVIKPLSRYLACSYVTKRPIFMFVSSSIRPSNLIQVFGFEDDYSFGILQSSLHWIWFTEKCGKLTGRFRYSAESVFDTFPWPQSPTRQQLAEVAAAAVALRGLRREIMGRLGYSLRALYRTLEEPGANPLRDAHTRLDAAVRAAYGMKPAAGVTDPGHSEPLAFLLALNLALAAQEKSGAAITPPGLPLPAAERAAFLTDDCLRA